MRRSKEMQEFVDDYARALYGVSLSDAQDAETCVSCGRAVGGFRDRLSRREYGISGLCQECQDSVFGEGNHDDF